MLTLDTRYYTVIKFSALYQTPKFLVKMSDLAKNFCQKLLGVTDLVDDAKEKFKPISEFMFWVACALSLYWSWAIQIKDSPNGENYFPFKLVVLKSTIGVMALCLLAIQSASLGVKLFAKESNPSNPLKSWIGDENSFKFVYDDYIMPFRRHTFTVMAVGLLLGTTFGETLFDQTFGEEDSLQIVGIAALILCVICKLLNESSYIILKRAPGVIGADQRVISYEESLNWRMIVPQVGIATAIFIFNVADGSEGGEFGEGGTAKFWVNLLLVVYVGLLVGNGFLLKFSEMVIPSSLMNAVMLLTIIAATAQVANDKSEDSIIVLLGLISVDSLRVFANGEEEEQESIWVLIVSRCLHLLVGVTAVIVIMYGMKDGIELEERDNSTTLKTGGLNSTHPDYDELELPATPKIVRDFALLSATLKIAGVLFVVMMGKSTKHENTLRQISSIGLLVTSSWLWAYEYTHDGVAMKEGDAERSNDLYRLEGWLLGLGIVARLVDTFVDTYRYYARIKLSDIISPIHEETPALQKPTIDNPRWWFVLMALGTSLGMLSRTHYHTDLKDDLVHVNYVLGWSIGLVTLHTVLVIASGAVNLIKKEKDSKSEQEEKCGNVVLGIAQLSHSPFVRYLVTTAVLCVVTMVVSEQGFAGEGDDKFGLYNATRVPANASHPLQSESELTVSNETPKEWYAVGALVSYIIADLVGHVFL